MMDIDRELERLMKQSKSPSRARETGITLSI